MQTPSFAAHRPSEGQISAFRQSASVPAIHSPSLTVHWPKKVQSFEVAQFDTAVSALSGAPKAIVALDCSVCRPVSAPTGARAGALWHPSAAMTSKDNVHIFLPGSAPIAKAIIVFAEFAPLGGRRTNSRGPI